MSSLSWYEFKLYPELFEQGLLTARSVEQTEVFKANGNICTSRRNPSCTREFTVIKVAMDEAMKCKETGEEKNIVFDSTGTGYFDMYAYQKYNDGEMSDYIPTDEELSASISMPKSK